MNRQLIAATRRVATFLPSLHRSGLKRAERHFLCAYIRETRREISRLFHANSEHPGRPLASLQLHGEFACDLMDFVDAAMPLDEYMMRANEALVVCENELLKARPNPTVFASAKFFALFALQPQLWQRYIAHMRRDLPWFAR